MVSKPNGNESAVDVPMSLFPSDVLTHVPVSEPTSKPTTKTSMQKGVRIHTNIPGITPTAIPLPAMGFEGTPEERVRMSE